MKAISTSICTIVVLAAGQIANATDPRGPRVGSYTLDVTFSPERGAMTGTASIHFDDPGFAGDSITCYLHGELEVDSMVADGVSSPFHQDKVFYEYDYSLVANAVTLPIHGQLPRTLQITYSGFFSPSKARSPSDYMRIDGDGVFLRAYGYSLWFPVFLPAGADDYEVDFKRVISRVPRDYTAIFGGVREKRSVAGDTSITEWSAPRVRIHEVQFTARRYQVLEGEAGFTICHLPDSASTTAARELLKFARPLCALYAGRYQTPGVADHHYIIEMPPYGDISSGSVTGLMESTWKLFADDENAQRALAHELVHPYVALGIPRDDPAYCLVVEGFPSYFHLPCVAQLRDADFYDRFVGWMEKLYLDKRATGKDRRGNPMPPEKPLLSITADELSTYKDEFVLDDRALLFLNYLLARMGPQFNAFTSELFNSGTISAVGFRTLIEEYLPGSKADVSLWLDTTEYPERLHFSHFRLGGR